MRHHYFVKGFKKSKRNKYEKTVFIDTTLSVADIEKAFKKCKYVYKEIIDLDKTEDERHLKRFERMADIVEHLSLFEELRIIFA
jgi:hypothetical protein